MLIKACNHSFSLGRFGLTLSHLFCPLFSSFSLSLPLLAFLTHSSLKSQASEGALYVSSPAGSEAEPRLQTNFYAFSALITHLMAAFLVFFMCHAKCCVLLTCQLKFLEKKCQNWLTSPLILKTALILIVLNNNAIYMYIQHGNSKQI